MVVVVVGGGGEGSRKGGALSHLVGSNQHALYHDVAGPVPVFVILCQCRLDVLCVRRLTWDLEIL